MYKQAVVFSLLFILLIASGCGKSTAATNSSPSSLSLPAEKFVMAGSGANIPVTAKLIEAYQSKTGVPIEIPGSIGSNGAVNAVRAGSLELGLISRPLTAEETSAGLKAIPYARIAVVFAGHEEVPDSAISSDEVLAVLQGTKTTWANGAKMYVYIREPSDSGNLELYSQLPGYKDSLADAIANQRWQVIYRDSDMGDVMAKTKGAFGLINMLEVARSGGRIKPLELDGVAPTPANVASGRYRPVLTLSFLFKGELTSRSAAFVEYAQSGEARRIMEQAGAVPTGR
ncbi:MAG: substrate-binding domain-containing protein [Negativicutes bacterium]|nr:substrate-binding domain-containing protein [Negativicutes bacterium]